jgi:hypothetical protein
MMYPATGNPASCEIRAVLCFLRTKNMSAVDIHNELCAVVYGQNIMSEGSVRQCCRTFKDGRTNVHDEEQSGRPSVVSGDLAQSVDQITCERRCFKFQKFRVNFHRFHTLFSMRLSQLG